MAEQALKKHKYRRQHYRHRNIKNEISKKKMNIFCLVSACLPIEMEAENNNDVFDHSSHVGCYYRKQWMSYLTSPQKIHPLHAGGQFTIYPTSSAIIKYEHQN